MRWVQFPSGHNCDGNPSQGNGQFMALREGSESAPNLADVGLDHADDVHERMGMERTEADSDRAKNLNCHEGSKTTAGSPWLWIPGTSPHFIRSVRHSGSLERGCQR